MYSHSEPRFCHHVSGLTQIKTTYNYGHDFRSHLEAYWKAECIKVIRIMRDPDGNIYEAIVGDYDLDCKVGYGRTKDEAIEELLQALDDRIR